MCEEGGRGHTAAEIGISFSSTPVTNTVWNSKPCTHARSGAHASDPWAMQWQAGRQPAIRNPSCFTLSEACVCHGLARHGLTLAWCTVMSMTPRGLLPCTHIHTRARQATPPV